MYCQGSAVDVHSGTGSRIPQGTSLLLLRRPQKIQPGPDLVRPKSAHEYLRCCSYVQYTPFNLAAILAVIMQAGDADLAKLESGGICHHRALCPAVRAARRVCVGRALLRRAGTPLTVPVCKAGGTCSPSRPKVARERLGTSGRQQECKRQ